MFADLQLIPDDGRAVAVFTADATHRAALSDALSWHVTRRFQSDTLDADTALELRAAGALADRIDEFRAMEGQAPVRLDAAQVRLLIAAVFAYRAERDTDSYQPPEERSRLAELTALIDPLFDLVADLDRADQILATQPV